MFENCLNMIFKQIRDFFIFTHKERNGLLLLIVILLLTIYLDLYLPLLIPQKVYDVADWETKTDKYYSPASEKMEAIEEKFSGVFDPNKVELKVLLQCGVPKGIALNWIKYIQKGGKFYKKLEVMKLYGMTEPLFDKIENFLEIPAKITLPKAKTDYANQRKPAFPGYIKKDSLWKSRYKEKKDLPIITVGINAADSSQLEALPGIGSVFASRIIKYRRLLGGFYDVAQLKEIYGMSEELWARFSPRLYADNGELKKLDINFQSLTELGRHPYIGFKQAKKIIRIRDKNGKFMRIDELAPLFSADSLKRLVPYLLFEVHEP